MIDRPSRAVVFAYHSVGVRGLSVLLSLGVSVPLVLSHEDDPDENRWFDSVRDLCHRAGIRCITPSDPNVAGVLDELRACAPDWLFSFYYRSMLRTELLAIPARGAYNLHGSLLPRYRGRVPVNWAVLHGERETGVSLHRMVEKPDAGALVDQEAVAILPNDTAHAVFQKLICAGETLLLRTVPRMLAGGHEETPMDLTAGSYFGGRRPEDGRIDWSRTAWEIHNLIRAVAPPYPGAFAQVGDRRLEILGSWYRGEAARGPGSRLYWEGEACYADCIDGRRTRLTRLVCEGQDLSRDDFRGRFGAEEVPLP
ncbi:MAG: formyltransferase [Pseudomonadota bacterium]|nr:formyltransferase [Pseudomonadota bacterium]